MTKTLICELTIALCLAIGGVIARGANSRPATGLVDRQRTLDGAFRDGLFVGRLTAEAGRPLRPPVGRWSSCSDRASFLAGYFRAYNDFLAGPSGQRQPIEQRRVHGTSFEGRPLDRS